MATVNWREQAVMSTNIGPCTGVMNEPSHTLCYGDLALLYMCNDCSQCWVHVELA